MKSIIKSLLISVFLLTISNTELVQAAIQDENVRKVTLINEFVMDESSDDYGLISSVEKTFFDDNGNAYTLTTNVFKEEFIPLGELLKQQRGNGSWTSCFASPGTYRITSRLNVNHSPFDALAVGNVVIKLTNSSVSITDVNTGGTTSKVSSISATANKVSSTFARFDYTVSYPGNSIHNPQTTYVSMDTEVAHGYSGSQLLYRYITNYYY